MNDKVTPQEVAKTLPVPACWAATFGIDPNTYWRDNAQLTACEREEMQDAADWIVEQAQAYEDDETSHQVPDEVFEEHDRLMFGDE